MRPDFENWALEELRVHAGWFGLVGDYDPHWSKQELIDAIDACNDWNYEKGTN